MNMLKKLNNLNIVISVIMFVVGLILLIKPELTISLISSLIGAILLVMGITSLIKYYNNKRNFDLIYGIICSIAGIVLIFNHNFVVSILPFVLGIFFIINGCMKIRYALEVKKYNGNNFVTLMVIACLITLVGLLFVVNPFGGAVAITRVVGVVLIIYAILDIINYVQINNNVNLFKDVFKK